MIRRQARRVRPGWAHRPRAQDVPIGRPVGLLATQLPARVRRRPPACRGGGAAPCASRPAGARNRAMPSRLLSHLLTRLPMRDLRTRRLRLRVPLRIRRRSPSMARFAVREDALARRSVTGIGRGMRSEDGVRKTALCYSRHHRRSREAPRKTGWGPAAEFEGQPGDQTTGPQGAPRTGAPTEGAKDAPFGRPVGLLAAHQPARVRRRPPACRGGGAVPGSRPAAVWVLLRAPRPVRRG